MSIALITSNGFLGISLFTYDKYTKSVLMPLAKDDELEVLHHLVDPEESEVGMLPAED
jgi:hypothetical protein